MIRKVGLALGAVATVAALGTAAGCSGSDSASENTTTTAAAKTPSKQVTASMTAAKVMGIDPQFASFVALLKSSGVDSTISKGGPYTLLVPSSQAFASFDPAALRVLNEDPKGRLADTLRRHIIKGKLTLGELTALNDKTVTTLSGETLPVKVANGTITVGGVKVVKFDIASKDAEIHVLDGIIPAPK